MIRFGGARDGRAQPAAEPPPVTPSADAWWMAALTILAVGAFLRFYRLDLKPFHHDEGVNGFFLTRLFREGIYQYDPSNYHGPSLYYLALAFAYCFGLDTPATRLGPAVVGLVLVLLALRFRRILGPLGTLAAAGLVALSPGAVFFSRYFIHEILLVCGMLGAVDAGLRHLETRRRGPLLAASAWTALCFTTKETAVIAAGVAAGAALCTLLYMKARRRLQGQPPAGVAARPSLRDQLLWRAVAVALFLAINVVLYSSFFTYAQGLRGALQALGFWSHTARTAHAYDWHRYLEWLWRAEPASLLLGLAGAALALLRARDRASVFLGSWAFGMLLAYSLIPYKTPWLALNISAPLALMAGYAVQALRERWGGRTAFLALLVAGLVSLHRTVDLNFFRYDDDSQVYVYAHTRRGLLDLVEKIRLLGERAGTGVDTAITVASPEHWPLSWYLRDYRRAGYWGHVAVTPDAQLVIGSRDQEAELTTLLGDAFAFVGEYPLRPGNDLLLYARKELVARPAATPAGPDRGPR